MKFQFAAMLTLVAFLKLQLQTILSTLQENQPIIWGSDEMQQCSCLGPF